MKYNHSIVLFVHYYPFLIYVRTIQRWTGR